MRVLVVSALPGASPRGSVLEEQQQAYEYALSRDEVRSGEQVEFDFCAETELSSAAGMNPDAVLIMHELPMNVAGIMSKIAAVPGLARTPVWTRDAQMRQRYRNVHPFGCTCPAHPPGSSVTVINATDACGPISG